MPIAFETGGLQQLDPSTWGNPATGDLVTLAYIDAVPDLPAPLADQDALRRGLTEQQAEFGCLIEAHVITVAGQPAVLRVEKFPLTDQEGLGFTAGIVLPKATCSAILKIMCRETGRSGVREAAIVPKVGFPNMFRPHPYAPDVRSRLPYNVADDAQWDEQFPDHPLTRARRWITHASRTALVDPRFAAFTDFAGPGDRTDQQPTPGSESAATGSTAESTPAGPLTAESTPAGSAAPDPTPPQSDTAERGPARAGETTPIPSAAALGTGPRKVAAPEPDTPARPPSMPRLPASAAAYAAKPAATKPSVTGGAGAVNFLNPPQSPTGGENSGDRRPMTEPPAGEQDPPADTTAIPMSGIRATSDSAGVTTAMPAVGAAWSADPARTTAFPAGGVDRSAPREGVDWSAPRDGVDRSAPRDGARAGDPGQARPSAAETTAIPFGSAEARRATGSEPSGDRPRSDGSSPTGPVPTETEASGQTRPIPKY